MKPVFLPDRGNRDLRCAALLLCAAFAAGCETETVVLSPAMHARVIDGTTGKPLDRVRVTLVSPDAAASETTYSDAFGFVDMPALTGLQGGVFTASSPRSAVHALFHRPGYQSYTIDSVNGFGFFKGYTDVHMYRCTPGERCS